MKFTLAPRLFRTPLRGVVPVVILSLILILTPMITSGRYTVKELMVSSITNTSQELHLLRGEHYLYITASEKVSVFHLQFAFPPVYGYQIPVFLELYNDTTANILTYCIENDTGEPNLVVNFTLGPMENGESVLLHFSCWVLVQNHNFSDLPTNTSFPNPIELPENTKTWLVPTPVVQVEHPLLQLHAKILRGFNPNMIPFADSVAYYIKQHRYWLFVLQLNFDIFFSQDALTTLFINGDNVGRSHLACAFFRSQGIPARVILALNDQGFWTQMHYMIEYYCPGYGWVLLDSTKGVTPYDTKHQIINRICYPSDEKDTKNDYIFQYMKAEERWLWIDNPNVSPYYVDCINGSKSQMFDEGFATTDTINGSAIFQTTKNVFYYYQHYLGMNLSGENKTHFTNAINYQRSALLNFKETKNMTAFLQLLDGAYTEYQHIIA